MDGIEKKISVKNVSQLSPYVKIILGVFFVIEIYLKVELERERQRELFHLLVHSSDGCDCQSWDSLKLVARSCFQVSHLDEEA